MKLSNIFKRNKYVILSITEPHIEPMKITFADHENGISKTYEFYDVPKEVREEFLSEMGAIDDYFKYKIKGRYKCEKIGETRY